MSEEKKNTTYENLKEEYPRNLLLTMKDIWLETTPEDITPDIYNGIQFAICMLKPNAQEVLRRRFQQRQTFEEIGKAMGFSLENSRRICSEALRKIRTPSYLMYIRYGLKGATKRNYDLSAQQIYDKGYKEGYRQGMDDANNGVVKEGLSINILTLPVEALYIQPKVVECLHKGGIETIGDALALGDDDFRKITGFTMNRRAEVAGALHRYGLITENIDWFFYYNLWEGRQKRSKKNSEKENDND